MACCVLLQRPVKRDQKNSNPVSGKKSLLALRLGDCRSFPKVLTSDHALELELERKEEVEKKVHWTRWFEIVAVKTRCDRREVGSKCFHSFSFFEYLNWFTRRRSRKTSKFPMLKRIKSYYSPLFMGCQNQSQIERVLVASLTQRLWNEGLAKKVSPSLSFLFTYSLYSEATKRNSWVTHPSYLLPHSNQSKLFVFVYNFSGSGYSRYTYRLHA